MLEFFQDQTLQLSQVKIIYFHTQVAFQNFFF